MHDPPAGLSLEERLREIRGRCRLLACIFSLHAEGGDSLRPPVCQRMHAPRSLTCVDRRLTISNRSPVTCLDHLPIGMPPHPSNGSIRLRPINR
jgi:hypothetical protein